MCTSMVCQTDGPSYEVFMVCQADGPAYMVSMVCQTDGPAYMVSMTDGPAYMVSMDCQTDGPAYMVSMVCQTDGPAYIVSMVCQTDGPAYMVSRQLRKMNHLTTLNYNTGKLYKFGNTVTRVSFAIWTRFGPAYSMNLCFRIKFDSVCLKFVLLSSTWTGSFIVRSCGINKRSIIITVLTLGF
ncbi:hypothetical protein KUTeg_021531 [Tegillarca granosa]|uniref:Uncharacterized protein n=1 Tax=Tegillarca granosa TaxID=220873 RepID=A0ABQ9E8X8_TEGGR|nr:hypothetical protein KUTeg_021531 [Tegillarca granosa]